MSDQIIIRGKVQVKEFKQAPVKPTVIIGIGGSGGDILLRVRKRFYERYGALAHFPIVSYLWLDTDATEKEIGAGILSDQISFTPPEKLMTTMADTTKVTNDLNQYPHIKQWFYPGLTKLKTMTEGAGQIRAYSRLGFYDHYTKIRNAIENAGVLVRSIENVRVAREKHHLEADPNDLQVLVVFSIAGGTGSGMFLDLAFLVKSIFGGATNLNTIGYALMPGLFNPREDRVFANGYAALKELEYYSYEHDFEVEWPDGVQRQIPGPPFNYTYLIDRTNYANNSVDFGTREIIFNMVAENIFKDFTHSDFAGYKRGVRVNLDQYLVDLFAFRHLNENRESIIDQKFITRYSSFGMASITVPANRIEQACAYKLAADVVDHWGSLSHGDFNPATLTETVLKEILPAVRMFEGNHSSQGAINQRHDIQDALNDDGRKQGARLHSLINQAITQTAREVKEGIHKQKNQTLSQYLRASVEREQGKLRNDKPDQQQWGDYARAIYFNKEEMVELTQKLLHQEVSRIINEQHQSVGYAIELLKQIVNVFHDANGEYLPAFTRARDQEIKRVDEERRRLDRLFASISRHEDRSSWDGRKKTILNHDVKLFEETAFTYLRSVLRTQIYSAAIEICERMVDYIGMAERTDNGELLAEGLIGDLYTLGGQLESLKHRLADKYDHFRKPTTSDLSLMLYDPADIENHYYPRYIGTGEKAQKQIRALGDQILQELRTSVMELPKLVRISGIDKVELQICELARKPFQSIKKDFDVLETLWKKYQNEADREVEVRSIYNKAKFWLHGGSRPRSYQLSPERHKILIGLPQDSADPIKKEEFKTLLRNRVSGDPSISILDLPDRSEIVFYSEVGGIPINWADPIPDLRQKYLGKQGEGEELHTDCREIKFEDLAVLDDRERAELAEAHECFLLGVIFGEIKPEQDAAGQVRYLWSEDVGVTIKRTVALGIEMRALAELISKKQTREILFKRINEQISKVRREMPLLAQFNALLGWYYSSDQGYPPSKMRGSDGAEHLEQSNMCRAVYKYIREVAQYVERQEQQGHYTMDQFRELSRRFDSELDTFAPVLIDGKRAFVPEAKQPKAFKIGG
jgi:hypothetical protein